jgi:hypothetical protein
MVWMNIFALSGLSEKNNRQFTTPMRKTSTDRNEHEKKSLPEYAAHVTRHSLLSLTSSLTKVSSQVHDFFAQINGYFALERLMRNCFGWMIPTAPMAAPTWPFPNWFAPTSFQPVVKPTNNGISTFDTLMMASATLFSLVPFAMQSWGTQI